MMEEKFDLTEAEERSREILAHVRDEDKFLVIELMNSSFRHGRLVGASEAAKVLS